jgi:hypothetical protein
MTPQEFQAKWSRASGTERQTYQEHFRDLCALLHQPTPSAADRAGLDYTFEKQVIKSGGGTGFADVWKRGHFGWEYKGDRKDLDAAYTQLLSYKDALENPPRYTPTTCFETLPLPWPPGQEPPADPRVLEIAAAAKALDELRRNWLNPAGATEAELKRRTLTNLYNTRPTWLEMAHNRLNRAV